MRKKSRYVVWIHVKPYVKKYLLMNFKVCDPDWPELVNLSSDRELSALVRSRLEKPSHRRDKDEQGNSKRSQMLAIEITEDDFYRYGWSLSATDESRFNKAVAIRCNTMMLVLLNGFYMFTGNLQDSIRRFYSITGYSDDDWPMDSIRKIWLRDSSLPKITLNDEMNKKNTRFLLDMLSKNGTISPQLKIRYEENLNQQ